MTQTTPPRETRIPAKTDPDANSDAPSIKNANVRPPETGGPKGPEPTRYGDWERNGRCIDF